MWEQQEWGLRGSPAGCIVRTQCSRMDNLRPGGGGDVPTHLDIEEGPPTKRLPSAMCVWGGGGGDTHPRCGSR